jgi:hypothetical protein
MTLICYRTVSMYSKSPDYSWDYCGIVLARPKHEESNLLQEALISYGEAVVPSTAADSPVASKYSKPRLQHFRSRVCLKAPAISDQASLVALCLGAAAGAARPMTVKLLEVRRLASRQCSANRAIPALRFNAGLHPRQSCRVFQTNCNGHLVLHESLQNG